MANIDLIYICGNIPSYSFSSLNKHTFPELCRAAAYKYRDLFISIQTQRKTRVLKYSQQF